MNAALWTVAGGSWLGALATVLVVGLALVMMRLIRRLAQQHAVVQALRADVESLCAGANGLDARLNRLERSLRRVDGKLELVELRDPGERPYAQAIRMVHQGADCEALIQNCGLVRSEAELIVMLHRVDKAG